MVTRTCEKKKPSKANTQDAPQLVQQPQRSLGRRTASQESTARCHLTAQTTATTHNDVASSEKQNLLYLRVFAELFIFDEPFPATIKQHLNVGTIEIRFLTAARYEIHLI